MKIINMSTIEEPVNFMEMTIGEIVTSDFRKAEIFKKYQLDFCCGGKKTVGEACLAKNIDEALIAKELEEMNNYTGSSSQNFNLWNLEFLTDYILNIHHTYVKTAIPALMDYTRKVARVHGESHPEVILIAENFYEAAEELINHMHKEENILFPYIKELVSAGNNRSEKWQNAFGTIQNPIQMMEHEHDAVGDIFKNIRALSDNYTPPESACTTYKVSFLKLREFEEDLHQHIHLENNILFPKSIQLEKELISNSIETV